jgi:multisubunit Na+/H+ antiporter MnhG subunit
MESFFMLSGSLFVMMAQLGWRVHNEPYLRKCFDLLAGTGTLLLVLGILF